jgi:hypothetical protein
MLKFFKVIGGTLLAIGILGLALGIGAVVTALSAFLGTALLGGAVLFIIILVVKEFLEGR